MGLRAGLADMRDATALIPISQSAAGWLLQLLALIAFVAAFVVRSFIRRSIEAPVVRLLVGSVRRIKVTRIVLGESDSDILTDDEIDLFIFYPMIVISLLLGVGGVGLVATDSFHVSFTFFKPR